MRRRLLSYGYKRLMTDLGGIRKLDVDAILELGALHLRYEILKAKKVDRISIKGTLLQQ